MSHTATAIKTHTIQTDFRSEAGERVLVIECPESQRVELVRVFRNGFGYCPVCAAQI